MLVINLDKEIRGGVNSALVLLLTGNTMRNGITLNNTGTFTGENY